MSFSCSKCGKCFSTRFSYKRHGNGKCSLESDSSSAANKELSCHNTWCNKVFSKTSNLKRHLKICNRPSVNKNTCFMCKKTFNRGTHLRRHMLVCTGRNVLNTCSCGKAYQRKVYYDNHVLKCDGLTLHSPEDETENVFPTMVNMNSENGQLGTIIDGNSNGSDSCEDNDDDLSRTLENNDMGTPEYINQPIDDTDEQIHRNDNLSDDDNQSYQNGKTYFD